MIMKYYLIITMLLIAICNASSMATTCSIINSDKVFAERIEDLSQSPQSQSTEPLTLNQIQELIGIKWEYQDKINANLIRERGLAFTLDQSTFEDLHRLVPGPLTLEELTKLVKKTVSNPISTNPVDSNNNPIIPVREDNIDKLPEPDMRFAFLMTPNVNDDNEMLKSSLVNNAHFSKDKIKIIAYQNSGSNLNTSKDNMLSTISHKLPHGSLLTIVFCGHPEEGMNGESLLSCGPTNIYKFPTQELIEAIKASEPEQVLLFFDGCGSYSNNNSNIATKKHENIETLLNKEKSLKAYVVFQVTSSNSYTTTNTQHSYFTRILTESIQGKYSTNKNIDEITLKNLLSTLSSQIEQQENGKNSQKASFEPEGYDLYNVAFSKILIEDLLKQEENEDYNMAINSKDPDLSSKFLDKYPTSQYKDEIKKHFSTCFPRVKVITKLLTEEVNSKISKKGDLIQFEVIAEKGENKRFNGMIIVAEIEEVNDAGRVTKPSIAFRINSIRNSMDRTNFQSWDYQARLTVVRGAEQTIYVKSDGADSEFTTSTSMGRKFLGFLSFISPIKKTLPNLMVKKGVEFEFKEAKAYKK